MSNKKDIHIFCMKWGTLYDATYVNRLHSMVKRNLTLPFTMVCFTDDETGIDQPVSSAAVGTQGGARNCDDCYSAVPIPGDITMKFGTLSINASYTSSYYTRNYFCTNSNNHPLYFTSTSSSNPYCLYSYSTFRYDRQFNGWMAPGYDGRWSGNSVTPVPSSDW